ncbi:tRNA cyclic N6-threonylcarbamoyladenosine(37) synthase TcdA [Aliidiomarina quisquiliarum]|uniref:tRNA cyclic N6-threonylcarbamoyladenosine(37) synthase TcdA n=1 Tax=Aliidiomarina quisquiliarum TaxID=2938947 RepID=UPI00208EBC86|nr:tRNA cyclic N6-threonylcarbamoyladenosine(37) synthase TcdA [Aliidiomarina quisquiliarum]MCO4321551.1 tRNA cyclic N6-threonylcarbamoyladenosine(37) synthase TcdA [Aliidiomarina quisquiliarum]
MTDYARRFGGIERLYGQADAQRIQQLHLAVAGLGGVGSWAAEALARTGVGALTLIDMDDICLSNVNRQSHALTSTVGQLKTEVLAARLLEINPALNITIVDDFIRADEPAADLPEGLHGMLDAIDSVAPKVALLAWCVRNKLPVVTTGGAGGQIDPTAIRITDVARVQQDPLMAKVRYELRRRYGYSKNPKRKFGIDCVYSEEQLRYPVGDGTVSHAKPGLAGGRLDCATGFGASLMVTGSFGFFAAARLLQRVLR